MFVSAVLARIGAMDGRILRRFGFFLLCAFAISDTSIAAKLSSQAIQETRNLAYQEDDIFFSPFTVRDTTSGNVPIVNPTTPGSTPIVNPVNPPSPTTTGPPTTITGPPATTTPTTGPPATFNPPTTGPPATTNPPTTGPPATTNPPTTGGGGSWCIANAGASQTALQVALDYACGYGGTDCSPIQPSGPCFEPNTVRDHASYAFNDYYQKNPLPTSCVFGGAAQITNTDPSHGSCKFASSSGTSTTPPSTPMAPILPMTPPTPTLPMTPPSINSPINPYTPGNGFGSDQNGSDYGAEPTGSPNSAGTISVNQLLLIIVNSLILSVSIADYF